MSFPITCNPSISEVISYASGIMPHLYRWWPRYEWSWVACDGQIIDESIHPDVDCVAAIAWNRQTPVKALAGP